MMLLFSCVKITMDRSKLVAIITGVISLLLAVGYLILVQLLDFRGEMIPAPTSILVIDPASDRVINSTTLSNRFTGGNYL